MNDLIKTYAEKMAERNVNPVGVLVGRSIQSILLADRHQAIVTLAETATTNQSEVERDEEDQD
jgi:hypothetical protein